MHAGSIAVARRFHGPPKSANGGYIGGRLAAYVEGAAEVTLRKPPPLDTPMSVRPAPGGVFELRLDGELVADARPATLGLAPPRAPSFEQAHAAELRSFDPSRHPLPTCFVCGPQRRAGDGLRIHPGPMDPDDADWDGLLAATWIPDAGLADESGRLPSEIVWAALDCPTAYAVSSAAGMRSVLLGRQAVEMRALPAAGSRCVLAARRTGCDGRKHYAESFLYADGGELLAECRATWIEVSPEVMRGASGRERPDRP